MKISNHKFVAMCSALAALVALPVVCLAAAPVPARAVVECSQALAARMGMHLAGDHYVRPFQMNPTLIEFVPHRQLVLTARMPGQSHVVARAICTYNSHGVVGIMPQVRSDTE